MKTQQAHFDAVVIGSGVAGSAVAQELCRAGMRTLVVEQGPRVVPQQVARDPLATSQSSPLRAAPALHPIFLQQANGEPARVPSMLGANVGGSSVHFGGNATRFVPAEFKQSARARALGLDVPDWPLTYKELAPWYDRVELEIGVSGRLGANPLAPPQSQPYPLPHYRRSSAGAIFEAACETAGLHAFPAPKFINTRAFDGRPGCFHQGLCSGFACHSDAKASALVTTLAKAEATGNLTIWSDTAAVRIESDVHHIKGVLLRTRDGAETFVRAAKYFVCCNAVGTARLLLSSTSEAQMRGLLNDRDLVGRHLVCPIATSVFTLHPHSLGFYQNAYTRMADDYLAWRDGFPTPMGFALTEMQEGGPVSSVRYGDSPVVPLMGDALTDFLSAYPNNIMTWTALGSGVPIAENRVTLSDTRDAWGLPAPIVHFKRHPAETAMMQVQRRTLERLSVHSDFEQRWCSLSPTLFNVPVLMAGGCRMGASPADSVVDGYGRSHRYPELFVVGSATFPTSGHAPPSETIIALAFRSADRALSGD